MKIVEARSWQEFELGDLVDLVNGRAFKPSDWSQNGLPIIRIQNLNGGDEYNYYEGEHDSKYVVDHDELLFSWSGSRGTSFGPFIWKGGKAILNQHIFKVIIKNERLFDKSFGFYVLKNVTTEIEKQAHGSAGLVHITKKTLEKIKFRVPDLPEQQQIAKILSTVDEKIDVIDAQITQPHELKKGLMQRLLTKGIGHTKFKDSQLGEIPESWELYKIGDVTRISVGKDLIELAYSPFFNEEYKYPVYSNTVENNGLYGYYNFEEYCGDSVTVIGRGVGVGTAFPRTGSFGAIGRLIVLFPNEKLEATYLSYTINFLVRFFTESSAIPQLTGAQISKYAIPCPPINEQKKVAGILRAVDEKIEVLNEKRLRFQDLKKALMQQLLTGRIRVNHLIKKPIPA
jgi:type I restriction enzyme, S subunit